MLNPPRRDHFVRRPTMVLCVCCCALAAAACNWFRPLAFVLPEPKRTVPAEFAHLEGSAAVAVWVHPETLYDFPNVRLEVASHVVDQLAASVGPKVAFADWQAVDQYIERRGTRTIEPEEIGREFDTRFVIYLELLEFALREPQMPDFLQGRVLGSVLVYDLAAEDSGPRVYDLGQVQTRVPDNPVRFTQSNALVIRKATYEVFAGQVARKFYDHQEAAP